MGQQQRHIVILLSLMALIGLSAQSSWAGKVAKVKGQKVFIILDAEEVDSTQKGDRLLLTTPRGKKRAIVVVRNIRGNKVIAQLGKGKAQKGLVSIPHQGKKRKKKSDVDDYEPATDIAREEVGRDKKRPDLRVGLQGSYGMASQNVDTSDDGTADMSGSMMGFKALIDYSLWGSLGVQGRVGMDMFSVTGSGTAFNYETNINYLTVDMLMRYYIIDNPGFGLFVNGGVGIYSPMSTDLTGDGAGAVIDEDSISTTSLLILGAGVSIPVGGFEIFAGAEYFYFPPSESVTTSPFGVGVVLFFQL